MEQSQHRLKAQMLPQILDHNAILVVSGVERNRLMTNHPSSYMSLHVPLLSVTWAVVMCNSTWEDGLTWPPCMNQV